MPSLTDAVFVFALVVVIAFPLRRLRVPPTCGTNTPILWATPSRNMRKPTVYSGANYGISDSRRALTHKVKPKS